jgi:KUP system potassium uptake protein
LITTMFFILVARARWHWKVWQLVIVGIVFGGAELLYFAANLTKVVHGGWLPLLIASLIFLVMTTWQHGRGIVTDRRIQIEGSLPDFVHELHEKQILRVPGTAVFPHPTKDTAPVALRANVEYNHVLHEHVVIVSVEPTDVPHIPMDQRVAIDHLGDLEDGVVYVALTFGFNDEQDLPEMLAAITGSESELDLDIENATYFVSRITIRRGDGPGMSGWRKRLFIGLARNAANPAEYFHLPGDRTVLMGSHVNL